MKWLVLLVAALVPIHAYAGNELGNGGDSYAQEFVAIGRDFLDRLRAAPDPAIPLQRLSDAVENTSVITKDKLELRGAEVDAINYPGSKRIELNRARWKETGEKEKSSLALHEYLGIAGIDDSRYAVSGKYVELQDGSGGFGSEVSTARWLDGEKDKHWSFSLGHGYSTTDGNLGKLYGGSTVPNYDIRVGYAFNEKLALALDGGLSQFGFTADPYGDVDIRLLTVGLILQYSPFATASSRLDPYTFVGLDQVYRKQEFQTMGVAEKDTAYALGGGLGLNYFLVPGHVSIWLEGKVSDVLFRDRYGEAYLQSGISDMKGLLYAANAGVKFYF
jgi:hypothetical protein